jgi:hypothetical protein
MHDPAHMATLAAESMSQCFDSGARIVESPDLSDLRVGQYGVSVSFPVCMPSVSDAIPHVVSTSPDVKMAEIDTSVVARTAVAPMEDVQLSRVPVSENPDESRSGRGTAVPFHFRTFAVCVGLQDDALIRGCGYPRVDRPHDVSVASSQTERCRERSSSSVSPVMQSAPTERGSTSLASLDGADTLGHVRTSLLGEGHAPGGSLLAGATNPIGWC